MFSRRQLFEPLRRVFAELEHDTKAQVVSPEINCESIQNDELNSDSTRSQEVIAFTRRRLNMGTLASVAVSSITSAETLASLTYNMSKSSLTSTVIDLSKLVDPKFSFGIGTFSPSFFSNLLARLSSESQEKQNFSRMGSSEILYFKNINWGLNYYGLTVDPKSDHSLPWDDWAFKYLASSPKLNSQEILADKNKLELFCKAYIYHDHNKTITCNRVYKAENKLISAWKDFLKGKADLCLDSDRQFSQVYSLSETTADHLLKLKIDLIKLILPTPVVADIDATKSNSENLIFTDDLPEFIHVYNDSFVQEIMQLIDQDRDYQLIVNDILSLVHDLRVNQLQSYFIKYPNQLENICNAYESFKQEVVLEVNRRHHESTSDESKSEQIEISRNKTINHLTWGSEQFHPALRNYKQGLFPNHR